MGLVPGMEARGRQSVAEEQPRLFAEWMVGMQRLVLKVCVARLEPAMPSMLEHVKVCRRFWPQAVV